MLPAKWIVTYSAGASRTDMLITLSWDTAVKGDPKNDFSVCTVWGELNGLHYVLDVIRKQMDFPELLKQAVALWTKYSPRALLIEDHGSGSSLIDQLRATHGIHAIRRRSRFDKQARLSNVLPLFQAGRVLFPDVAPWDAELRRELLGFPNAKYDDQVDSVSQYLGWVLERSNDDFNVYWPTHPPARDDDDGSENLWDPGCVW